MAAVAGNDIVAIHPVRWKGGKRIEHATWTCSCDPGVCRHSANVLIFVLPIFEEGVTMAANNSLCVPSTGIAVFNTCHQIQIGKPARNYLIFFPCSG